MKLNLFTFISSAFLTTVISVIVYFFKILSNGFDFHYGYFPFIIIGFFLLNYLILDFLFGIYAKKEIQKISGFLPAEFIQKEQEEKIGFRELGERISGYKEKNSIEIDMMKEMEKFRREYIGNVSHELKTPLFSIQGYIETLRDGAIENLNIRDKYLDRINKSVERLINIVMDLDAINKYEAGEITIKREIFDINILFREIFELLDLETRKIGAKMILETSSAQIMILADKQKIGQVLINLLSNAIHYCNREKAVIRASTRVVGKKCYIMIQDNGMGIKPEILPRIFERFFRVESSRSRKDGGSGLGLSIVKHILHAHGETIDVESTYLEGTSFSFFLPKG